MVVFLAHLCSDPTVIQEMQASATALFSDKEAIRLEEDVKFLDELHSAPISLSLPDSTPDENRRQEQDTKDVKIVEREAVYHDGRSVTTHPEESGADAVRDYAHAMRASRKTIQILGQVLRNEVGAIEAKVKLDLVAEIFRLARRIMGDAPGDLKNGLPRLLTIVYEFCRGRLEDGLKDYQKNERAAEIEERAKQASRQFAFGASMFFVFEIVRHVAESAGFDQLNKTFARVVEEDDSKATRIIDLAIDLGSQSGLPRAKAVALYRELDSQFFTQTLLRLLVRERLYLYDAHMQDKQAICADLEIDVPKKSFDPRQKKFGPPT
jgi:hypothetical protein